MFENIFVFSLCSYFAFQNSDYSPACKFKIDIVSVVASNVHRYLMPPKINIGLRQTEIFAFLMSMPEAAVNEYDCLILFQYNIRRFRQFTGVDSITQTLREKILPNNHFRLGIFTLYRCHTAAPLLRSLYRQGIIKLK